MVTVPRGRDPTAENRRPRQSSGDSGTINAGNVLKGVVRTKAYCPYCGPKDDGAGKALPVTSMATVPISWLVRRAATPKVSKDGIWLTNGLQHVTTLGTCGGQAIPKGRGAVTRLLRPIW